MLGVELRHPNIPCSLKINLRSQLHQPSAHNLEYVPPRVILRLVSRLLVQDGVVVENVVDVEVRLHLLRLSEPEDPAETEIELFNALPVQCSDVVVRHVRDEVDRCSLGTGWGGLARAGRKMAAQRTADLSIA